MAGTYFPPQDQQRNMNQIRPNNMSYSTFLSIEHDETDPTDCLSEDPKITSAAGATSSWLTRLAANDDFLNADRVPFHTRSRYDEWGPSCQSGMPNGQGRSLDDEIWPASIEHEELSGVDHYDDGGKAALFSGLPDQIYQQGDKVVPDKSTTTRPHYHAATQPWVLTSNPGSTDSERHVLYDELAIKVCQVPTEAEPWSSYRTSRPHVSGPTLFVPETTTPSKSILTLEPASYFNKIEGSAGAIRSSTIYKTPHGDHLTVPKNLSRIDPPSPAASSPSVTQSMESAVLFCLHEGCQSMFRGEYRHGARQRHMRLKHCKSGNGEAIVYRCSVAGCGKIYLRQDARLKHYRKHHPELNVPSPVRRKTKEKRTMTKERIPQFTQTLQSRSGMYPIRRAEIDGRFVGSDQGVVEKASRVERGSSTPNNRSERAHNQTQEAYNSGHNNNLDPFQRIGDANRHGSALHDTLGEHGQAPISHEADCKANNLTESEDDTAPPARIVLVQDKPFDGFEIEAKSENDSDSGTSSMSDSDEDSEFQRLGETNNSFFASGNPIIRSHGNNTDSTRSTGNNSGKAGNTSRNAPARPAGRKRPGGEPTNNDNNDDDRERNKRPRLHDEDEESNEESDNESFACPFFKLDPVKHIACFGFSFTPKRFGDLRQHFKRLHRNPVHCARCGTEFHGHKKHDELGTHSLQCMITHPRRRWDGITADQWELMIKKRKSRLVSGEDHYFHICDIIFEGDAKPSDPHAEQPSKALARIKQRLVKDITAKATSALSDNLTCRINVLVTTLLKESSRAESSPAMIPANLPVMVTHLVKAGVDEAFAAVASFQENSTDTVPEISRSTPDLPSDSGIASMGTKRAISAQPSTERLPLLLPGLVRDTSPDLQGINDFSRMGTMPTEVAHAGFNNTAGANMTLSWNGAAYATLHHAQGLDHIPFNDTDQTYNDEAMTTYESVATAESISADIGPSGSPTSSLFGSPSKTTPEVIGTTGRDDEEMRTREEKSWDLTDDLYNDLAVSSFLNERRSQSIEE